MKAPRLTVYTVTARRTMRFLQGYEHVSTNNGASRGICISSGGYAYFPGNASRPVYASSLAEPGLRRGGIARGLRRRGSARLSTPSGKLSSPGAL